MAKQQAPVGFVGQSAGIYAPLLPPIDDGYPTREFAAHNYAPDETSADDGALYDDDDGDGDDNNNNNGLGLAAGWSYWPKITVDTLHSITSAQTPQPVAFMQVNALPTTAAAAAAAQPTTAAAAAQPTTAVAAASGISADEAKCLVDAVPAGSAANFVAARLLGASQTPKAWEQTQIIRQSWTTNKIDQQECADVWMYNYGQHQKICMRLNHVLGKGCRKVHCTYAHDCLLCKKENHGAYQVKSDGRPVCPKAAFWDSGLWSLKQALGVTAVDDVRRLLARAYNSRLLRIDPKNADAVEYNRSHVLYPYKQSA